MIVSIRVKKTFRVAVQPERERRQKEETLILSAV